MPRCWRLPFQAPGTERVDNLYARWGEGAGKALAFAGHSDVVPAGDTGAWRGGPFAAEIRDGRLNFYFCGIRMRSIPLDYSTHFELREMGRLKVLRIQSKGSTYVPNGALDKSEVVEPLRANGVAERQAV